MSENYSLQKYQTRVVANKSAFSGSESIIVSAISGPRMLVTLDVTAIDSGTTVSISVQNGFESSSYLELDALTRTTVGQTDKLFSDFHTEFKFVVTVSGSGTASFKVGVTLFDLGAVGSGGSGGSTDGATEDTLLDVLSGISSIDGKTPATVTGRVPVDGSGVTQPVSASALPLPAGAATEAKQDDEVTALAGIDARILVLEGTLESIDARLLTLATVDNQTAEVASLASVDTKLSSQATAAKQDTGNTSLDSIDTKLTTANAHLALIEGSLTGPGADTAVMTQVASSASSVTLLTANSIRRGLIFFNNSQYAVYVAFAATATTAAFTFRLTPKGLYESATVYRGEISAIWIAAGGDMQITELE